MKFSELNDNVKYWDNHTPYVGQIVHSPSSKFSGKYVKINSVCNDNKIVDIIDSEGEAQAWSTGWLKPATVVEILAIRISGKEL